MNQKSVNLVSKNVLITGITGFLGKLLAEKFLGEGENVYGSVFDRTERPPKVKGTLHLIPCDIRIASQVKNLIKLSKPDIIFHMAGQPFPMKSWEDPVTTFNTNVNGTLHLFSSIIKENLDPKILVACSSAEYGQTTFKLNRPLLEEDPLLPLHPYGLSKVCQDLISYQFYRNYKIKVIRARIFNTIGPGRVHDFIGDVSKQIADIKKGLQKPIVKVGNLETKRDMTDVRDQIFALTALMEHGRAGEAYNVCSGIGTKMEDLLKKMIKMAGKKVKVQKDPKKARLIDEPSIVGDPSKIRNECYWERKYTIENTLEDCVNYW